MSSSKTEITVRYSETDQMGIVHHSNYINYFEVARTDFIYIIGQTYKGLEDMGFMLPVLHVDCQYRSPAKYDDRVIVETKIKEYNGVRMTFEYVAYRKEDETILVHGSTSHCWTDKNLKPIMIKKRSPELHEKLLQTMKD
ncbi:acyl-CoA thioesterase [Terrilactibacillus laevilacticus]|uniref:acyl-CoA thioesterase n=1 Tax=Terrilactibacillus laevilacticus TaxID=1380157 RepID=UPI00114081D6|nr:acyl-CoA thioesterase [Terrilactibacillus laevilacticus]